MMTLKELSFGIRQSHVPTNFLLLVTTLTLGCVEGASKGPNDLVAPTNNGTETNNGAQNNSSETNGTTGGNSESCLWDELEIEGACTAVDAITLYATNASIFDLRTQDVSVCARAARSGSTDIVYAYRDENCTVFRSEDNPDFRSDVAPLDIGRVVVTTSLGTYNYAFSPDSECYEGELEEQIGSGGLVNIVGSGANGVERFNIDVPMGSIPNTQAPTYQTTEEMEVEWEPSDAKIVRLFLDSGDSDSNYTSIECTVPDTGSFTVPKEAVQFLHEEPEHASYELWAGSIERIVRGNQLIRAVSSGRWWERF